MNLIEKIYEFVNLKYSNNYALFSVDSKFEFLNYKFFKREKTSIEYQEICENPKKEIIELVPDQHIEVTYYEVGNSYIGYYLTGVIVLNGEQKIYSLIKKGYEAYRFYDLIDILYEKHLTYNQILDCRLYNNHNSQTEEMIAVLIDKLKTEDFYKIDKCKIDLGEYKSVSCFKYKDYHIGFINDQLLNSFFIKEKSLYSKYIEWRWKLYNNLGIQSDLSSLFTMTCDSNVKPSKELADRYNSKNFDVSKEQIEEYDEQLNEKVKGYNDDLKKQCDIIGLNYAPYPRSILIENSYFNVKELDYYELKEKFKSLIVYANWWDTYNYEEFSYKILSSFLDSTRKLIGIDKINDYFKSRFKTKTDFINYLFSNYDFNFLKDIKNNPKEDFYFFESNPGDESLIRSIRILENECRYDHNVKVIGSFYNENLLFRTVKENFGNKFKVVSQYSPDWLAPQSFDIYFPEINFAIEYQGEQHQKPIDFGGQGEKIAEWNFIDNKRRDLLKKQKADQNGCYIYYVYPEYDMKDVISELKILIKLWQKKELK